MQYIFHLQENLSFRNFGVWLIINELRQPLEEKSFRGWKKFQLYKQLTIILWHRGLIFFLKDSVEFRNY